MISGRAGGAPSPHGSDADRIDSGRARCKDGVPGDRLRGAWTAVLLAWLLATLPILLAGAGTAPSGWLLFVPVHGCLIGWTWLVRRDRRRHRLREVAADWTFPVALPFLYAELPILMAGMPGAVTYRDGPVAALEAALFGGQPAFEWASALPVPWVSELLHLGYLAYYPLIYLPPALLWLGLTGPREPVLRRDAFDRTVLALCLAMLPAFAIMVAWPVQGPRYLGVPAGIPHGPARSAVLTVLEAGSSRGAAFPSSHVSLAVAQTALALRWQRPVGVASAAAALLLAAGAVYGGFHYAVDVLAGGLLGLLAAVVALGWHPPAAERRPALPDGGP